MRKKIGLLGMAMAVYALNIVALGTVLPRIMADRGIGAGEAGFLFTAHFIGFIAVSLAAAALAGSVGKKRLIQWAMAGYTAGFVLLAAANSFPLECMAFVLLGGCGGIVECLGAALASDLDPDRPEHAVNAIQIFFSVGAVASPLIASAALAFVPFWKSFYLLLAALSAVVFLMMLRTGMEPARPQAEQRLRLSGLKAALREPGFLLMCLCMAAYTGSEVGVWGWLSALLQKKMAFTELGSGLTVSLFWLAMTAGRVASGALLAKVGARMLVAMLASFSAVVTLAMAFAGQGWLLLLLAAGIGLGCASQFPLIATRGSRLTALPSGAAFTALIVCGTMGSATVPLGMGLIGEAALDKALLVPVALFALVAAVMLIYKKEGTA